MNCPFCGVVVKEGHTKEVCLRLMRGSIHRFFNMWTNSELLTYNDLVRVMKVLNKRIDKIG